MSKVCKRKGKSKSTFSFDIFEKKGLGVEDGVYKNGAVCFVFASKKTKKKAMVVDGDHVIDLGGGNKVVLNKYEFDIMFEVVEPADPKKTKKTNKKSRSTNTDK